MSIPFIDLKALHAPMEQELIDALTGVLRSGRYVLGPEVERLERSVARLCGVDHAVGVSSGTDALLCALGALGVGPGDRVITTSFSFVATADVIARLGAVPVFVDIEEGGYNLDVEQVAAKLDEGVKAVVAVHLFGRMADMERLLAVCGDIPVVEDAAQSLGARRDGLQAAGCGALGCSSFFPTKNVGALGDGGVVTGSDEASMETVRMLRSHGGKSKDRHELIGGNYRLDAIQAAVLNVKWPHLERWTEARRRNAALYHRLFSQADLPIDLPQPDSDSDLSVWNQYVIALDRRDDLRAFLQERGVASMVYYRTPLHLEPCFADYGCGPGDAPRAEAAAGRVLALPVHPALDGQQVEFVVKCVAEFFGR